MLALIQCDASVPAGILEPFLRRRKVAHRLISLHEGAPLPDPRQLAGAIVLGGYMGVGEAEAYPHLYALKEWLARAAGAELPLLGICLGGQLLAFALGAAVHSRRNGEHGVREVFIATDGEGDPLLAGIPSPMPVFQWHNDSFDIPSGARSLAFSAACPGQMFRLNNWVGLQFHPEVDVAIVAAWCEAGGCMQHLEPFVAAESAIHQVSFRLFENFLSFCAAGRR